MGLQECLLCRTPIGSMEGSSSDHAAHREHLHLAPFSVQISIGFIPVDLRLIAPVVRLRYENLPTLPPEFRLPLVDVAPDARLRNAVFGHLFFQPGVDPMRGVALLAG